LLWTTNNVLLFNFVFRDKFAVNKTVAMDNK